MLKTGKNRLYQDLAWLWPIISPPEEFVEETRFFNRIIGKYSKTKPGTLLHLGCGGGHNDSIFKKRYQVTGVDVSRPMLKNARKLNPENTYLEGDMRRVRLKERFDIVTSIDSLAYMNTRADLKAAFKTAYHHLKPGGMFFTLVEFTKEAFRQNKTGVHFFKKGDMEVTYLENHYDPVVRDDDFEITFVHLVRKNGRLTIHEDRHLCGIFSLRTWVRLLKETGFKVKVFEYTRSPQARGGYYPLLVCVK
jgi:SAM-dependent methyltransferase